MHHTLKKGAAVQEFYERFYAAVEHSPVHAEFCERVFGRNLGQHGFADMAQLAALLDALALRPGERALDLGCGSGLITEYLADCTGAHFTGIDYIPAAIEQARQRTAAKADRLEFRVGDLNTLDLPAGTLDAVIAIDTLYFSSDYVRTLADLARALRPGGRMGLLYSHGREPWVPREQFAADALAPDRTPLAVALRANGLSFRARDFTADDYRLAQRRLAVLAELRPRFEAEGLAFVYENRIGDAHGVSAAVEEGLHARYLYTVELEQKEPEA